MQNHGDRLVRRRVDDDWGIQRGYHFEGSRRNKGIFVRTVFLRPHPPSALRTKQDMVGPRGRADAGVGGEGDRECQAIAEALDDDGLLAEAFSFDEDRIAVVN